MASGTILLFEFADASNNSIFFSFNYGNDDADVHDIKNAINTIIDNGSVFTNPPVAIKSAKAVITSDYEFDLSD